MTWLPAVLALTIQQTVSILGCVDTECVMWICMCPLKLHWGSGSCTSSHYIVVETSMCVKRGTGGHQDEWQDRYTTSVMTYMIKSLENLELLLPSCCHRSFQHLRTNINVIRRVVSTQTDNYEIVTSFQDFSSFFFFKYKFPFFPGQIASENLYHFTKILID